MKHPSRSRPLRRGAGYAFAPIAFGVLAFGPFAGIRGTRMSMLDAGQRGICQSVQRCMGCKRQGIEAGIARPVRFCRECFLGGGGRLHQGRVVSGVMEEEGIDPCGVRCRGHPGGGLRRGRQIEEDGRVTRWRGGSVRGLHQGGRVQKPAQCYTYRSGYFLKTLQFQLDEVRAATPP